MNEATMDTITKTYRAVMGPGLYVDISADVAECRVMVSWSFRAGVFVQRYLKGTLVAGYKDRWIPENLGMEVARTVKSTIESAILNNDAIKDAFEKQALGMGFTDILDK